MVCGVPIGQYRDRRRQLDRRSFQVKQSEAAAVGVDVLRHGREGSCEQVAGFGTAHGVDKTQNVAIWKVLKNIRQNTKSPRGRPCVMSRRRKRRSSVPKCPRSSRITRGTTLMPMYRTPSSST